MASTSKTAHEWHFFRAGGVDQVSIRSGADLLALAGLDPKLWVALAMPTTDVDLDPATLALLDRDHDGRIRIPDILDAVAWIGDQWKNPDDVLKGGDSLALDQLKAPEVIAAAKRILADVGAPASKTIALDQVTGVVKAFASTKLNGDGVVTPESTDDADLRAVIEDVMKAAGTVDDRSGKPGIDQAKADGFFTALAARAAWIEAGAGHGSIAGGAAGPALDALAAVRGKLDDYFARCQLAAFDPRTLAAVSGQDADLAALASRQLTSTGEDIARLPLARIEANKPLPLRRELNPAWAAAVGKLADLAVAPVLGARDTLTLADHDKLIAALAPYQAWRDERGASVVDVLDDARVTAIAAGDYPGKLAALIAADRALDGEYGAFASVEKLLRFQRDFGRILRNFVNFSDFYTKRDAVFQSGTLYLDSRAFRLVVPVSDAGKHGALASMSASYLMYCDLVRHGAKKQIAVAVTNGDADNLFVGRNGVFYDRAGDDWDATIAKIVTNPISVREAFWSPYKKLVRLVEDLVNKRAAEAEAKSGTKIEGAASKIATVDQKAAAPPPEPAAAAAAPAPPAKKGLDIGIIAVISLAVSAVVGALVGMLAMLVGLGAWMPLGIVALLLAISGPSMLLAWMKLRRRNVGPILDANGWAVNSRARVNVAFGAALTDLARLPKGASRSLDDPYADKPTPWKRYTALVLVLLLATLWYAGKLDRYLPGVVKSVKVLGKHAPGATP